MNKLYERYSAIDHYLTKKLQAYIDKKVKLLEGYRNMMKTEKRISFAVGFKSFFLSIWLLLITFVFAPVQTFKNLRGKKA